MYRATALGFYQRDNENTSYQERRLTVEELLNKFMAESVKRHDEHSSLIKEIRALLDAAIRNQGASIKELKIQIGQMRKEDDKMPLIKLVQATIPFPSRLKENGNDEKVILKELKKLKVNSTESAISLRRLLKEKSRAEEEIKAIIKVHCLVILKDALPLKEKDPRSFTLPCSINNMCFDKALTDLGASVNVMPYSTFTNLGLGKLAPTKLIIELADKTVKRPKGIAENVLVGIDKFVFPVDYIVLDMPEDIKIPLIFGRPFLSTSHAKIDKVYVLGLREQMELDFEATLMGDLEFRDFSKLNDLNELLELNDHEMEDLDSEIEVGEIIDEPKILQLYRIWMLTVIKTWVMILLENYFVRLHVLKQDVSMDTIHDGNDSVTYQMARSHPRSQYDVYTTLDTAEVLNANEESGGMHIIWNLMYASHAGIQTLFCNTTHNVADNGLLHLVAIQFSC
ncbi:two-component response regulator-like APRR2 isoform X1 [Tanacetum coccineum]